MILFIHLSDGENIIIRCALQLFFLCQLAWTHFDFSRWQALAALVLTGILGGLESLVTAESTDTPLTSALFLGIHFGFALGLVLTRVVILWAIMRWWMPRGGRWDGRGKLFNLLVASLLVIDILSVLLAAAGTPALLISALRGFGIYITCNALAGAIPEADMDYIFNGIIASTILFTMMLVSTTFLIKQVFGLE